MTCVAYSNINDFKNALKKALLKAETKFNINLLKTESNLNIAS